MEMREATERRGKVYELQCRREETTGEERREKQQRISNETQRQKISEGVMEDERTEDRERRSEGGEQQIERISIENLNK